MAHGRGPLMEGEAGLAVKEYVHSTVGEEVQAIAGYYCIEKEAVLSYRGRELLYAVGNGIVENSCCGAGGCRYALVAGYLIRWKGKKDEAGREVSEVEPVADPDSRAELARILEEKESVSQIQFL